MDKTELADVETEALVKHIAENVKAVRMSSSVDDVRNDDFVVFQLARPDLLDVHYAVGTGRMFKRLVEEHPNIYVLLYTPGYDTDPRELWEVPEFCAYVKTFALAAGIEDAADLRYIIGDLGVGLLTLCGVPSTAEVTVIKKDAS